MKVGIVILPYYNWPQTPSLYRGIPHLGIAALVGFLKQQGISAEAIDLRNARECNLDYSINLITSKNRFVSETVALPILIPKLDRYFMGQNVDELLHFDASANVYDEYTSERNLEKKLFIDSIRGLDSMIKSHLDTLLSYDIIGFSTYFTNFYAVMLACMALRRTNPKQVIVVGGPEVTQSRNSALLMLFSGLVDAVIPGAGELPLQKFIQAKQLGEPLEQVPGIMAVIDGKLIETPPPAPFPLEDLPLPDYSDFDPNNYLHFIYSVETSRGCPFRCKFCAEYCLFGKYQRLSSSSAYKRFTKTLQSLRCHSIYCADSLMNANEKWLLELSDRIIADSLDLKWSSYLRPKTSRRLISRLRKAGFSKAFVGIESVSDKALETMNKKSSYDDNLVSVRAFIEEGIPVSLGIILGYPGENEEDHKRLVGLLEYFMNHNALVIRTYKNSYQVMGFRSIPFERLPVVSATALPLFLKPPSDVYKFPDKYGMKVTPFGKDIEGYRFLPKKVKNLMAKIPWTFVSQDIETDRLYERLFEVRQKSDRGYFSSYAQLVHSYFSCIRDNDRFFMVRDDSFSAMSMAEGLKYHSIELDIEISSKNISYSSIRLFKQGATFKEFVKSCTSGTKATAIEAKHLVAMAAVEGSLFLKQGEL
jgi:radical SAM superfamily enzyme YgiQ (UPF0313 family)